MLFILLFSIDWPTYVWVLLGLAPLIVTVISWIIKIKFRKPETVAYGSSGSLFGLIMMFYFIFWLFTVVLNEWIAPWVQTLDIAPELKIIDHIGVNDGKNWYFHAFTLYCFICFFFMNFRELNEEQAKKAKEKGSLVASFGAAAAGSAVAAGSAATSVLGMIWGGIMAAAYPIVSITATTVTYISASAAMFFAALVPMIIIGAILAVILKFVLMIVFLFSWLPLYIAIAIKFFSNLRITVMGPTKVEYKRWDD